MDGSISSHHPPNLRRFLMGGLLTFREAGQKLGVDRSVLKRMLREGRLPEAEKVRRSQGWVWVLPEGAVEKLKSHPDLVIDLNTNPPQARIEQPIEPEVTVTDEAPEIEIQVEKITETQEAAMEVAETTQDTVADDAEIRHLSLASNNQPVSAPEHRSASEIVDTELLDRLLAIQEAKTEAMCRAEQSEYALEAAKTHYSALEEELNVERKERSMATEKLREERLTRKVADVKIAELNEQLVRETTIAEAERQERITSTGRTLEAEQKATYAFASMGWWGRRRYLKALRRSQDAGQL